MKTFYRYFTNSPIEFAKGKLLKGVEIFKAGVYRGKKYTKADLEKMVNNFNSLKRKNIFPNVPVRVDHTSSASDLAGYIEKIRVKGKKLVADLDITEDNIYKKIKKTTLRSRSVEIGTYEDNKGNEYYPVIFGVAWVDIPQVEGLAPVFAYSKDAKIINLNNPKNMNINKEKLNKDDEKEKVENQEGKEEEEKENKTEEKEGENFDKDENDENTDDENEEDDNNEEGEEEGEGGTEEVDADAEDEEDIDEEDEDENEDEEKSDNEKDEKNEEGKGDEEKTPDEEADSLIEDIDKKIEDGEEEAFVDETDLSKRIDNVMKMANKITVGRAKKLIASLQSVAKSLIDNGKYYSASRISELLSSLETILGTDSVSKKVDLKWDKKTINNLPDSSFAVIEPAYSKDDTDNKNARHLPYKNADGKVNLANLRNALIYMSKITSITDSISDNDLRDKAKAKLTKIAKRYLKTTEYAKTLSKKEVGDAVKLRREDYNQLIRDAERADELQKTVKKTVLEKRTAQIDAYCKEGKSTPAMAEIEKKLVISFNDDQMAIFESFKAKQPKIVKFNEEQIRQDSEEPNEKSTSKKEADKLASDFIQRTNPKLPDSPQENKEDKDED